ncbi:uncharacterized protein FOMMEDRAFT_141165 [Fomitiporia mediterranea MF3/22]|uniref:uncharacterized protein n=1 Tax=Fomitiporia mediterranea (strain MF3/22) TaxID=694068 RepID=UPI0004409582|nr:uncharacterized protein FOMMEDRAFT_141165 [Fomitiporia mediterranea MF3/22]EJD01949.1 hypothetical protein FOMMEDRAFT_141165 [Fomitiporia mediterranea MF3/22]
MLAAASKSRPALVAARSSFHANQSTSSARAASTLTTAADIFDAPGRMIFDSEQPTSPSLSAARRYYPSHFRPIESQSTAASDSPSPTSGPATHRSQSTQQPYGHVHAAHARQMSTVAHQRISNDGSTVIFDGPARPRNPPRVTTRHDHSRPSSTSAASLNASGGVDMIPPIPLPEPLVFDGPAQPRRLIPVQIRKSSQNGVNASSAAAVGALAGVVVLGSAYEVYEAHQDSRSTPRNVFSYSRSRESVSTHVPTCEPEEDTDSKHEVLRDEILPTLF